MDELYQHLEARIRSFEAQYQRLKDNNHMLKQNAVALAREKELLLSRYKNSIEKIEKTLSRLKTIEGLL